MDAIADWIYGNPVWLVGLVIVGGIVALSCGGLLLSHALIDHPTRSDHNDLVGATAAVIGTVAAILLAFIGVATWETFSRAGEIADREASGIANLYFDSYGVPDAAIRVPIQGHIRRYLDIVVHREWPAQQAGAMDEGARMTGRNELLAINRELAAMEPRGSGQSNIQAQMFTSLNQLYTARRERVTAANGHVPAAVWAIILLGTAGAIGYTYLFGAPSLRMHLAMTGSVAASLALVVLLIVVTDYPFRGEVSIGTDAYLSTLQAIDAPPAE